MNARMVLMASFAALVMSVGVPSLAGSLVVDFWAGGLQALSYEIGLDSNGITYPPAASIVLTLVASF